VQDAPSDLDRVRILSEALPYLQKFRGRTIVVKYGGAAMKDESLKQGVINDLVLLACVGVKPVLVHGGGPEINSWLAKVGIEPNFKNGLRVTGMLASAGQASAGQVALPTKNYTGIQAKRAAQGAGLGGRHGAKALLAVLQLALHRMARGPPLHARASHSIDMHTA
jgi:hypothetical protein